VTPSHHAHDTTTLTSRRTRAALGLVVGVLALAALVGVVVLWPSADRPEFGEALGITGELVDATAVTVENVPCLNTSEADGIRCTRVTLDVTSGPTEGEEGTIEIPVTEAGVDIDEGDALVVQYQPENPSELRYFFQDFQRRDPLLVLAIVFAVAVIALGRWQGVRALIALGVTGVVLIGFAFPSIIDGNNPTAVALVSAVVIALVALYLTHGVSEMITVALLALTAVLAVVFTQAARFTGFGSEDAFYLQFASADIDVKGLVLAGIIIGSLGVLDDVTVTQVSAVWQLHEASPRRSPRRLYTSALRIGRDHIASTVNTLVLAYAGASLPLLLVFASAGRSTSEVAVGELVAVEIVRTLVGSIGLVAAVPITTAVAAAVVARAEPIAPQKKARTASVPEPQALPSESFEPVDWDQFAPKDPEGL
jgi:uncharacterized membrane protein